MWGKIPGHILFYLVLFSLRFNCCTCIEDQIKKTNDELIHHSNNDPSKKQNGNLRRKLSKSSEAKTLNVLALGGSTTWGARLKDLNKSYPYLLEQLSQEDDNINFSVTNKAMRATDAYYPSLCIQSILQDTNDKEFHVILLEYSLNGPHGIDTLVKRLQYRFPGATFIYVHLYSLSTSILDNSGAKHANEYPIEERNSVQWHWDPDLRKTAIRPAIDKFFQEIGGALYSLPRSKTSPYEVMPLFSFDWHHLSEKGHMKVASDLYQLIVRQQNDLTKNSPASSKELIPDSYQIKWGYGDSCVNWFETGEMTLHQEGGQMNPLYTREAYNQNKFSLEFSYDETPSKNGGTIGIMNSHSVKVPLFITYLSTPNIYPVVEVHVDDHTKTEINPDRDMYHVAVTQQVGFAEPGYNNIIIQPKHQSTAPFRLVGIALFGFHYNRNVPLRVAENKADQSSASVVQKQESDDERVLNVLSLGGPITWGGNLPNGEVSYPSRIGQITNHKVTNMGVRASDAYYPSLCIESMLGSEGVEYDVILLEYSNTNPMQHLANINAEEEHLYTKTEIRGLRMLVKRLQYRFPNAIIIYIHLYSLRHIIKDSHGHLADEHDEPPPDFNWSWAYPHKQIYRPPLDVKSLMKSVGGYVYSFQVPDTIKKVFTLFQPPTYHSLSARGHRLVGDALAEILTKKAKFDDDNVKHNEGIEGTWGWGDQCLSWLGMGGTIPIEFGGGQKRDMGNFQWSIEFVHIEGANDGGWIKVVNSKEVATPLYFTYLIGGAYEASTIVSVNGVTTELSFQAKVSQDKFQTTDVGWVAPGTTLVSIKPGPGSVLQLIGISLFGFYQHKELPLKSMHNTILDDENK